MPSLNYVWNTAINSRNFRKFLKPKIFTYNFSIILLLLPSLSFSLCSVMSDSLWPSQLQSTRPLCPWASPGKNTRVGCHALLQGIFPTQGLSQCLLRLLHCRQILYHNMFWTGSSHPGNLGSHKHWNRLKYSWVFFFFLTWHFWFKFLQTQVKWRRFSHVDHNWGEKLNIRAKPVRFRVHTMTAREERSMRNPRDWILKRLFSPTSWAKKPSRA